jgi:hypothetical protein
LLWLKLRDVKLKKLCHPQHLQQNNNGGIFAGIQPLLLRDTALVLTYYYKLSSHQPDLYQYLHQPMTVK